MEYSWNILVGDTAVVCVCTTNQLEDKQADPKNKHTKKKNTNTSRDLHTAAPHYTAAAAVPDRLAEQRAGSVQGSVALVAAATANGLQEASGDFPEHFPCLNDELLQILSSCRVA